MIRNREVILSSDFLIHLPRLLKVITVLFKVAGKWVISSEYSRYANTQYTEVNIFVYFVRIAFLAPSLESKYNYSKAS